MKKLMTVMLMLMATSLVYAQTTPKKIGQTQLPDGRWIDVFDNGTWKKASNFGTFKDSRDGKVYKTVIIGKQVWMAENLALKPNSGNYWAYDNDQSNVAKYGYLYDWQTARNVCPAGWHLPSDAEWTQLIDYLGGGSVAGGKMKTTTGWRAPNKDASNESGFSGLPGGYRYYNGTFNDIGTNGLWWSSTEANTLLAWTRHLNYSIGSVTRYSLNKGDGFSVRCLRD